MRSTLRNLTSYQTDTIQHTLTLRNGTKPTNQIRTCKFEKLLPFLCSMHQAVCVCLRLFSTSVFPLLTQMFWLHKHSVCCLLDECAVTGSNCALWLPDLLLVLCCRLIFSLFFSAHACVCVCVHISGHSHSPILFLIFQETHCEFYISDCCQSNCLMDISWHDYWFEVAS